METAVKKYKLLQIQTYEQLNFVKKELTKLIGEFLEKGKSRSTVDKTMDLIIRLLPSPAFRLYIVLNDDLKAVSYYIIQLGINDETFEPQAFIYQLYSAEGLIKEMNDKLEAILKKEGVLLLRFVTRRNAEAFQKNLGDGWEISATELEKRIG